MRLTFDTFQDVIGKYIKYSLGVSDLSSFKEVILEILSILKRVSCSSSVEILSHFKWNSFANITMSTKVFIHSYSYFIEGLEDDSVIGFENSYSKLKHLSIQYGGVIPSKDDLKSRIFSLILLCAYYAEAIKSKIFAPLDPKMTDSLPLDPNATDPGALLLFFRLISFMPSLESIFSSCGLVDKEFVRYFFKREDFRILLDKNKFESHQHRYSLLLEILKKLDAKGQWGLKVYLRLVYGISI